MTVAISIRLAPRQIVFHSITNSICYLFRILFYFILFYFIWLFALFYFFVRPFVCHNQINGNAGGDVWRALHSCRYSPTPPLSVCVCVPLSRRHFLWRLCCWHSVFCLRLFSAQFFIMSFVYFHFHFHFSFTFYLIPQRNFFQVQNFVVCFSVANGSLFGHRVATLLLNLTSLN